MGRWWLSGIVVIGGCVANNALFNESGGGDGSAGSTSGVPAQTSTSSAETSGGDGSAVGTDGDTTSEQKTSGVDPSQSTDTAESGGESETTDTSPIFDLGEPPPDCNDRAQPVVEDAFLVTCASDCGNFNYGATEESHIWEGPTTGLYLFRGPEADDVMGVEVTITVAPSEVVAALGFSMTLVAVDPPCPWEPGEGDGEPLGLGEPGVTWNACSNAGGIVPWAGPGSASSSQDNDWLPAGYVVNAYDLEPFEPVEFTFTLDRVGPGPAPASYLLQSNVPSGAGFSVYSAESAFGPKVTLDIDC
ncbi:MAG: hypothetical protein AAGA54_18910 [Myxococcota bacterium]